MSIRLLLLHAGVPAGVLSHGHMELKFAKIYKRCFLSVLLLSSLSSTSFCWKNKRANLPVSWRICEMFSVIKLKAEDKQNYSPRNNLHVLTRRFVSRLSHRDNSSGSLGIPPDISRRNELGKTTKITKIQGKQRSSITRRNPLFNDFPPRRLGLHLTRERCTMWPTSDVSIGQVFDYYSEKGKPVWSLLVFSEHGLEVPFVFRFYLFDLGFPTVTLKFAAL